VIYCPDIKLMTIFFRLELIFDAKSQYFYSKVHEVRLKTKITINMKIERLKKFKLKKVSHK
jgi:hypothetical protein